MGDILEQLQALCGQLGVPVPPAPQPVPSAPEPAAPLAPKPALYQPVPGIDCWRCDYKQLPLGDGQADAIITDIPWASKWLRNVEEFSAWCAAKLKPGGIMTTLYTAYNLPLLLAELGKHLHYVWTCASPMHGCVPRPYTAFITRSCTLCVVYSNTTQPFIHRSPSDLLPYSWREKTKWHEHQQSLSVVQYLVEHFSRENDLVVDSCSGGWTTAEACWRTGRQFLGSDDRANCLDVARDRFASVTQQLGN